jgi:hypothetical protein
MSQANRFCEQCGAPLAPDVRFCESCGQPVAAPPPAPQSRRAASGRIGWPVFAVAGLAAVVAMALLVLLAVAVLGGDKPTATPQAAATRSPATAAPTKVPAAPAPTTAAPTAAPAAPAGERFSSAEWGIELSYPEGWIADDQSDEGMLALLCGPSAEALTAFEEGPTTAGQDAPTLAVMRGPEADMPHVEGIENIGAPTTAGVLEGFLLYLEDQYYNAGLDLERVGEAQPASAGNAEGLRAELTVAQDGRGVWVAAFLSGDTATLLMMTGPQAQEAEARAALDGVLETLRLE